MKHKILVIIILALGMAPVVQAMEYSGLPDKEPSDKSGKEEIIEIEEVEQAPADMLKMISKDGQEFFVDTLVAQASPQIASSIKFKQNQNQPLVYKSEELSSNELQALIALLRLQHTTPYLQKSDIDKIDAILMNLPEKEQSDFLNEAFHYFELPIAAFYMASQLEKGLNQSELEETIKKITPNEQMQNIIMHYYNLLNFNELTPDYITQGFSVQDLFHRGLLPEVDENGILNFSHLNIDDLRGLENIPNKNNITKLSLKQNKISDLPPNIFNGFDNLKELDLSFNQLKAIPGSVLSNLTKLEKLYLNENDISDIDPTIFNNLEHLTEVDLSQNDIPKEKQVESKIIIWE